MKKIHSKRFEMLTSRAQPTTTHWECTSKYIRKSCGENSTHQRAMKAGW
jgi:hypothetical protein